MSDAAHPHRFGATGGNHAEPDQLDGLTIAVTLDADQLAALAEHVAELLAARGVGTAEHEPTSTSPNMTVAEAAEYMRCNRQRIYDLLSQRRLTRVKDGRRTLVRRAEVESYLSGVAHSLPTLAQRRSTRGRAT